MRSFFITFFFITIFLLPVHASHISGLELNYRWKSSSSSDSLYEFTMVLHTYNANPSPNLNINARSVSLGIDTTIPLTRLPTYGWGIPNLYLSNVGSCSNNFYWQIKEEFVYRGDWNSLGRAKDWQFYVSYCCFPTTGGSAANIGYSSIYVECGLNNLDFPDSTNKNNSVFWHNRRPNVPGFLQDTVFNLPQVTMCEGRQVHLDQSVREYDGDAVIYELTVPRVNNMGYATYINGYSFSNPMPTRNGPLIIDSLTGQIFLIPDSPTYSGVYVIGIKATEFRNDTIISGGSTVVTSKVIGYNTRNLFIVVEDSASCPDSSLSFTDTTKSYYTNIVRLNCSKTSFRVRMSRTFNCTSADNNGSFLNITKLSNGNMVTVDSIEIIGCSNNQFSKFDVFLDSIFSPDTLLITFKKGSDGDVLISPCGAQLEEYVDTVMYVFIDFPTGNLLGAYDQNSQTYSNSIERPCGNIGFVVNFSEYPNCKSVALDGSDFVLVNDGLSPITYTYPAKASFFCDSFLVKQVTLYFNQLDSGHYKLALKMGSDSNSLKSRCGYEWPADTLPVVISGLKPDLGPDTTYCLGELFSLLVNPGNFYKYSWNTGGTNPNLLIAESGTYYVTVSNSTKCEVTDTIVVKGIDCYNTVAENNQEDFIVYPNPTQNFVSLESLYWQGDELIELYSITGKKLKSQLVENGNQRQTLELNSFESGVYFIQVLKDQTVLFSDKLIIK